MLNTIKAEPILDLTSPWNFVKYLVYGAFTFFLVCKYENKKT